MPLLSSAITPFGPTMHVSISCGNESMRENVRIGKPDPGIIFIQGLIDTGASITGVSRSIMDRLGLVPHRQMKIHSASRTKMVEERDVYHIGVYISDGLSCTTQRTIEVVECMAIAPEIEALIGWDLLKHSTFMFHKDTQLFTIKFDE